MCQTLTMSLIIYQVLGKEKIVNMLKKSYTTRTMLEKITVNLLPYFKAQYYNCVFKKTINLFCVFV